MGLGKDAVFSGGAKNFLLGNAAGGGFELSVGTAEDAGFAIVNVGIFVTEGSNKDFGIWKGHVKDFIANGQIVGSQIGEIDTSDHVTMCYEKETIAEEWSQYALVKLSGYDLLNGILDGFETSQCLDLSDDADRIGDDGGGGVEQVADLCAEAGVKLLDRLQGAVELAVEEGEEKDDGEEGEEGDPEEYLEEGFCGTGGFLGGGVRLRDDGGLVGWDWGGLGGDGEVGVLGGLGFIVVHLGSFE